MVKRYAAWLEAHARWVVALILLLGVSALAGLYSWDDGGWQPRINPAIDALLPVSGEARDYLSRVNRVFGQTDAVVAALYVGDPFSRKNLQAVQAITDALQSMDSVERVWSLATAPVLLAEDQDLDMRPFTASSAAGERLRDAAGENPLYARSLLSEDGRATALIIYLRESSLPAGEVLTAIREAVERHVAADSVRYAGSPVLKVATSDALQKQLARVLPTIFLLIVIFLGLGFQSLRAVLLPLLTLGVALIFVLELIALSGSALNLITAMVPPVVVTVGLAYSLHTVTSILRHAGQPAPVRLALAEVTLPLLMTALTTAAGFLALTLSPLTAVREFAILAATGIVISALLALTLLPALFVLAGCHALKPPPGRRLFRRLAIRIGNFNNRYRRAILGAGALVCLIALTGMLRIESNTDYVRDFSGDAPVRMDFETINRDFGGVTPLSIMLETSDPGGFAQPEKLQRIASLQQWLEAQPEVGYSRSMVDMLKLLNRALHEGQAEHYRIPDSMSAVRQTLLFGSSDALSAFVDRGFGKAHILVNARISDSASVAELADRVHRRLDGLGSGISGQVTGTPVLMSNAVSAISSGQFLTIAVALLLVFLLLWALFTSARAGALALLPNLIPVLVYFGVLGFSGITLNPTTSLIACIVLGIAVDDTLYYFARFNQDARRMASESKATVSALHTVLRPVTYSSMALVAGFMALTFSGLQNQAQFGALAACTLVIAWIVDVTFTPALAARVRIVTLWDVLRLDLGERPQSSIPLFSGLSLRQARIFALLSNLKAARAGQRILSQGEKGSDMYVVIDGELRVWVQREGEQIELARLHRGAVLGEVGHFSSRRTANVDAVSDGRLLQFSSEDLESLRRRSPRTAAIVFRNLNGIQAQRLAQATERLRA